MVYSDDSITGIGDLKFLYSRPSTISSMGRTVERNELLQGTLDMLILRTPLWGSSHGHQIGKHIQRTTHDFLQVQHGSLYAALHRLERKGLVTWGQILTGSGATRQVLATLVGIDFFRILGVAPELGRTFQPDDLKVACTVVLKHCFRIQTFAGQKEAIGRHIQLNENACTVGVMPAESEFYPDAAAMWTLITPDSAIAVARRQVDG
jgi:hypothetical protein